MSLISSVMLVQSDPRLGDGLRYGFEREGAAVQAAEPGPAFGDRLGNDCQLIVTGSPGRDAGLSLLADLRRALATRGMRIPVLYVGNGLSREEALDVGATEFLPPPVYVRDVVTMARILCSPIKELNSAVTGELSDHFGLFYIVRALSAVKRKGVLTMVRGLRRGELRFFEGEVTSAQVGMLHGLAALHQLLLWTDARFELRPENVVRRQQIPLSPVELMENSAEFLRDIREVAEGMSPSSVYSPDADRASQAMTTAPDEVRTVLRLFDGNRSVADVIEDSPYRVFETLRIANRLKEYGAIEKMIKPQKAGARTALAIEEWLVDADGTRSGGTPTAPGVTKSGAVTQSYGRRKKRKKRREQQKAAVAPAPTPVDWGSLPDRRTGVSDGDPFSPVVPSASASGEINSPRPASVAPAAPVPAVEIAPMAATRPSSEPPAQAAASDEEEEGFAEIPDLSGQWETYADPDERTPLPPPDDVMAAAAPSRRDATSASGEISAAAPRRDPNTASGEIAAAAPKILVDAVRGPAIVVDQSVTAREPAAPRARSHAGLTLPHAAPPPPAATVETTVPHSAPPPPTAHTPATAVPAPVVPVVDTTEPHAAPPPPPIVAAVEPVAPVAAAPVEPVAPVAAAPVAPVAVAPVAAAPVAPVVAKPVAAAPAAPVAAKPVAAAPAAAPQPAKPAAVPPPSPFASPPSTKRSGSPRAATPTPGGARKKRKSTQPPIDEKEAFTDAEEAFFTAGSQIDPAAAASAETFEDLDEDYEVPKSFWQRLLSRPDQSPKRKG